MFALEKTKFATDGFVYIKTVFGLKSNGSSPCLYAGNRF